MSTECMQEIMNTAVWIHYAVNDDSLIWHNVIPVSAYSPMWFGKTEESTEEQWLLAAYDCKSGKVTDFAMKNIKAWRSATEFNPQLSQHVDYTKQ